MARRGHWYIVAGVQTYVPGKLDDAELKLLCRWHFALAGYLARTGGRLPWQPR